MKDVKVGDTWIDSNGRTVKILRASDYIGSNWWCEDTSTGAQVLLHEADLQHLDRAVGLPYATGSGVYTPLDWSGLGTWSNDQSCKHEWVDAGFHFSKWCCKHCNVDKPQ